MAVFLLENTVDISSVFVELMKNKIEG